MSMQCKNSTLLIETINLFVRNLIEDGCSSYSSCMCPPAMLGKWGSSELKETADTRDGSESHSGG